MSTSGPPTPGCIPFIGRDSRVDEAGYAPDEYREQVEALEVAWQQGAAAKASLKLKGQRVNASTCTGMYNATVASRFRWDDERFRARGQEYFVAGCLGRGKPGSSFTTTTTQATP